MAKKNATYERLEKQEEQIEKRKEKLEAAEMEMTIRKIVRSEMAKTKTPKKKRGK